MTSTAAGPARALARLDEAYPAAGRLARLASLAVRVDARLLRRLRLRFASGEPAGCEADLWFSSLVAARDARAFRWAQGAPEVLRAALLELPDVDPAEVRAQVAELHAGESPLLQLEEEIAWLVLRRAPRTDVERALGQAVRWLGERPEQADDLAAWAVHALPELPAAARSTAAAFQLHMAASTRFGTSPDMAVTVPADVLAHVAQGVLAGTARDTLRVVRDRDQLVIEPAPDAAEDDPSVLAVPRTRPLWLEVSSEGGRTRNVIALTGRRTPLDADDGDVLRNALGEAWVIESARHAQIGSTADADAGELVVGWLIVLVPPGPGAGAEDGGGAGWEAIRAELLADLHRAARRLGRVDVVVALADDPADREHAARIAALLADELTTPDGPAPLQVTVPAGSEQVELRRSDERTVALLTVTEPEPDRSSPGHALAELRRRLPPADYAVLLGGGARAAEARFPPGQTPLVILDPATPWAPPPPGVQVPPPLHPLWTGEGPPSTSYVLGGVRLVAPATADAEASAFLATVERSWRDGEWRERRARIRFAPTFAGDPGYGWAERCAVIVVGDPGVDDFVAALRGYFQEDGGMPADGFFTLDEGDVVVRAHEVVKAIATRKLTRVWLFVRSSIGNLARQPEPIGELIGDVQGSAIDTLVVLADVPAVLDHLLARSGSVTYAVDERSGEGGPSATSSADTLDETAQQTLDDMPRQGIERPVVKHQRKRPAPHPTPPTPTPTTTVTGAALEALLGAGWSSARGGIAASTLIDHVTARCPTARTSPGEDDVLAPAPKHRRYDTGGLRRIRGGPPGGWPRTGRRCTVVTGATAPARSAWIDSNLGAEVQQHDVATVLGWTPSLQPPDDLLAHARRTLLDWTGPPASLDGAAELAWRIEGSNALFVLDELPSPPSDFEGRLVRALLDARTGRVVIATAHVADWLAASPAVEVVDLDQLAEPPALTRLRSAALQPTVTAWLESLTGWGDHEPVLAAVTAAAEVAISQLTYPPALAALNVWKVEGEVGALGTDPFPSDDGAAAARAAWYAREAALALVDGDRERMLHRVRDTLEVAIATIGRAACARALGGTTEEGAPEQAALDEAAAGASGAIIRISEVGGYYQLDAPTAPGDRPLHVVIDGPDTSDGQAALRAFAPLVRGSDQVPVALEVPSLPGQADAARWELGLVQAAAGDEGPRELMRHAGLYRTHRLDAGRLADGPAPDLVSVVGSEIHGDGVRRAYRSTASAGGRLTLHLNDAGVDPARAGANLHVLGAPVDATTVRLQANFAEYRPGRAAGVGCDVVSLAEQLDPPVLILQDVPTTTLAHSLQARQRAETLRVMAGGLAPRIPLVVVIPAVPHDQSPRVLHMLFSVLGRPDTADAILAAATRARRLLVDRSTGNHDAALALAADLVVWAPGRRA